MSGKARKTELLRAFVACCGESGLGAATATEHRYEEIAVRRRWRASRSRVAERRARRDFVKNAAMSDMYEVAAGKIAVAKGQADAVKQFG